MTPDQLTALAARLRDHAAMHESIVPHDDEQRQWHDDLLDAAEYLRQCAQAEPVAWLHPANSSCVTTDPDGYERGIPLYTHPQPLRQSLHETDIYDFAGWLTTRPGVMQVGSSCEAGPMADAVGEYIRKFPEKFGRDVGLEAHPQPPSAQADAVEALQKVSSGHDIGYAAGWRNCADEATRIVASHIDRLEPGRQQRTRDALLALLASMRSILVVQRAVSAAPQPPSAQGGDR